MVYIPIDTIYHKPFLNLLNFKQTRLLTCLLFVLQTTKEVPYVHPQLDPA